MKTLTIGKAGSKNFTWPSGLEAVTQTFAILAKKGSGKSYCASVTAEEMLDAGQQIVVLDPTGAWFGLQSSADGKHEGYPVVVFGGDHANVALEESAGELIAQAIVEKRFSAVLDLSLFRKGASARFVTSFLEALYRLNRQPLHLFIDEADDMCPQKPFGNEAQMVGAVEDVVKRGRKKGIGCTLITQRPADLAKQVLTQCEVLVALRLVHPRDIAAIKEWVNVHADPQQSRDMIASLPSLPIGTAWVWSPGWGDIFERVQIRKRSTFDSGATPKPGERAVQPQKLAPVDIEALGNEIAQLQERKKAEDPKELKKRIAELQKEVAAKPIAKSIAAPQTVVDQKSIDRAVAVRDKFWQSELAKAQKAYNQIVTKVTGARNALGDALGIEWPKTADVTNLPPNVTHSVENVAKVPANVTKTPIRRLTEKSVTSENVLSGPEQRIVNAIAWLHSIGNPEPEQTAVAFIAGYTFGSGGFNNPKGSLRVKGLIEYLPGNHVRLTDAGHELAATPDSALDSDELQRRVLERLPGPEQKILNVLLESYPESISTEDCAVRAGYTPGSGGFNNPKGRLRTLGLIEYPKPGYCVAREILFV
jgi:hypothetical protein